MKENNLTNSDYDILHGASARLSVHPVLNPENTITFNLDSKEVLKFNEDKLFLYGEQVSVHDPEVIEGLKNWLKNMKYICDCE